MAAKNDRVPYVGKMSADEVTRMVAHQQSGAAGFHADQVLPRRTGTGRTNRVGSRSAARREAIRQNF